MTYIQQNGPLNLGLRIEHGFALLAKVIMQVNGVDVKISDFLPDRTPVEPEAPASGEDILRLLQSLKK